MCVCVCCRNEEVVLEVGFGGIRWVTMYFRKWVFEKGFRGVVVRSVEREKRGRKKRGEEINEGGDG